jgi:hypothetical protein
VGGQHHALAALPLGKNWYSSYRRLGGPQGRSGHVQKISPPPGFEPQTVQPVVSAIPTELPSPQQKRVPGIFPVGKGGQCVGLTTLPPSCADCLKILEPQPAGALGLSRPVMELLYLLPYLYIRA